MKRDHRSHLEGIAVGFVAGVLTALGVPWLVRRERARRGAALGYGTDSETSSTGFAARREAPESAGDPVQVAGAEFVRTGGAPGPGKVAEKLSMPGRPGELLDHSNPNKPVKFAGRQVEMHGKTPRRVAKKSTGPAMRKRP